MTFSYYIFSGLVKINWIVLILIAFDSLRNETLPKTNFWNHLTVLKLKYVWLDSRSRTEFTLSGSLLPFLRYKGRLYIFTSCKSFNLYSLGGLFWVLNFLYNHYCKFKMEGKFSQNNLPFVNNQLICVSWETKYTK